MQQAMLQGLGGKAPAPKPAAPDVLKANIPKPAPLPPAPVTNDERASGKYNMAMMLAKAGRSNTAEEYCQFIVKTYPGTQGAAQAHTFLDRPVGP